MQESVQDLKDDFNKNIASLRDNKLVEDDTTWTPIRTDNIDRLSDSTMINELVKHNTIVAKDDDSKYEYLLNKSIDLDIDIHKVSLDNMSYKSIPTSIHRLTSLQVLVINNTCIHTLDVYIGTLVCIDVRYNMIHTVGDSIYRHTLLTSLDISYNCIDYIHTSVCKLDRLCILSIQANRYTCIPKSIGYMSIDVLCIDWFKYMHRSDRCIGDELVKFKKYLRKCKDEYVSIDTFISFPTIVHTSDSNSSHTLFDMALMHEDQQVITKIVDSNRYILTDYRYKDMYILQACIKYSKSRSLHTLVDMYSKYSIDMYKYIHIPIHTCLYTLNICNIVYTCSIYTNNIYYSMYDILNNSILHIIYMYIDDYMYMYEVFNYCIQYISNVNTLNNDMYTPLMLAAVNNMHYPYIISDKWNKYMNSKSIVDKDRLFNFYCTDIHDDTPLHIFTKSNSIGMYI